MHSPARTACGGMACCVHVAMRYMRYMRCRPADLNSIAVAIFFSNPNKLATGPQDRSLGVYQHFMNVSGAACVTHSCVRLCGALRAQWQMRAAAEVGVHQTACV